MKAYDILIIGGGASGLTAAVTAAKKGKTVCVLERDVQPALKLLATGNGRCNFTNMQLSADCYYCSNPVFVEDALNAFGARHAIEFFDSLHVGYRRYNTYVYPRSEQASAVRNALLIGCESRGVSIFTETEVSRIYKDRERFLCDTNRGHFAAARCILACGGLSGARHPAGGYDLAEAFGHTVHKPLPALTALETDDRNIRTCAGVRTGACVTLLIDGEKADSDTGEVQFNESGISGIPVMQVSSAASSAIDWGQTVEVCLDFFPEYDDRTLSYILSEAFADFEKHPADPNHVWYRRESKKEAKKSRNHPSSPTEAELILAGYLPRKLAAVIARLGYGTGGRHVLSDQTASEEPSDFYAHILKNFRIPVSGVRSFEYAQVTRGGVSVDELHTRSMESRLVARLYFAGEILDVDGRCGGYNLQWAWSSGFLAGNAASRV